MEADTLIQRLWNYCNILRDDGLSYGDYVEQLTYLLFLKMAEEHSKPPFLHLSPLSRGHDWSALAAAKDEEQLELYERILRRLGRRKDLFGII
jgi:type I restriction enzyme M protein